LLELHERDVACTHTSISSMHTSRRTQQLLRTAAMQCA
jgi:hypothetical protein